MHNQMQFLQNFRNHHEKIAYESDISHRMHQNSTDHLL